MISQEMAVTLSYSEKLRDESRRQAAGGAGGASERGTACQKTSRAYFSTFRHVPDAFCSALLSAGPAVNDVARFLESEVIEAQQRGDVRCTYSLGNQS